jgi:hypothetical protein
MKLVIISLIYGSMAFGNTEKVPEVKKPAFYSNWRLLDLDYFGMTYKEVINYRDAYFPEFTTIDRQCTGPILPDSTKRECWILGADAMFDINIFAIPNVLQVYFRNDVNMHMTTRQVRQVGWQWEYGVDLGKIEFSHKHHSSHYLDGASDYEFLLYDVYKVTFNIHGKRHNYNNWGK